MVVLESSAVEMLEPLAASSGGDNGNERTCCDGDGTGGKSRRQARQKTKLVGKVQNGRE